MKKILLCAALLLGAALGHGDTTTARFHLVQPAIGSTGWGVKTNNDWTIVDSSAAALYQSNIFKAANEFDAGTIFDGSALFNGSFSVGNLSVGAITGYDTAVAISSGASTNYARFGVNGVGGKLDLSDVAGQGVIGLVGAGTSYFIGQNQRLGIGMSNPTAYLDVSGQGDSYVLRISTTGTGSPVSFGILNDGSVELNGTIPTLAAGTIHAQSIDLGTGSEGFVEVDDTAGNQQGLFQAANSQGGRLDLFNADGIPAFQCVIAEASNMNHCSLLDPVGDVEVFRFDEDTATGISSLTMKDLSSATKFSVVEGTVTAAGSVSGTKIFGIATNSGSEPTYSFSNLTNTGIGANTSENDLIFITAGSSRMAITPTAIEATGTTSIAGWAGSASQPSFQFGGDGNTTGMYYAASNTLGFTAGNSAGIILTSTRTKVVNYLSVNTDQTGSTVTVNGRIESLVGGFKFPDGSVQTTAASVSFPLQGPTANVVYGFSGDATTGIGFNGTDMKLRGGGTNLLTVNSGFGSIDITGFLRPSGGALGAGGILFNGTNDEIAGDASGLYLSGDGSNENITISGVGHIEYKAAISSATTCGTSPALVGNDNAGIITTGSGSPTACTLTFASSWSHTAICTVSDDSAVAGVYVSTASASAVTFGLTAGLSGGKIYYQCTGYR